MTPWYKSKTVWFNIITTLVAALTFLPTVSDLLPAEALPYLLGFVGVLNVILRVWFTDSAVTTPFGKHVK